MKYKCNRSELLGLFYFIIGIKYLNNIIEQGHRNIKKRIAISTGFKEFEAAQRTLAEIEIINMIRKDQILKPKSSTYKTFCSLAS